jgi:hypothetical protein
MFFISLIVGVMILANTGPIVAHSYPEYDSNCWCMTGGSPPEEVTQPGTTQTATAAALSQQETYWITYLREEEKAARDIYDVLGNKWKVPILQNISAIEQKHMDAIKTLVDAYGVADPVGNNRPGAFTNSELQKLYNDLIKQGSSSKADALKVGVLVEQTNIGHLSQALSSANHELIKSVYTVLQSQSNIHQRAFELELSKSTGAPIQQQPSGGMLTTENIIMIIAAVAVVAVLGAFLLRGRRKQKPPPTQSA